MFKSAEKKPVKVVAPDCRKHPSYHGIGRPEGNCKACWAISAARMAKKR